MPNSVLEADFPSTFQQEVTKKLCHLLSHHYSVNLVGMKRVGINSYLRFFLSHPGLIKAHISENQHFLFIMVDLNDLVERELYPFWILTQKRIVDAAEATSLPTDLKDVLQKLFLSSIQTKELFLVIDNIRTSLKKLVESNLLPVIIFNRFDRLEKVMTADLFCNLEGLRDGAHKNLSYIFTTFRKLDQWTEKLDRHPSLSLMVETLYVKPLDEQDADLALQAYIKPYSLHLTPENLKELIFITGGNIQYIRLSTLNLLNHHADTKNETDLNSVFLNDERVGLQSEELWESLSDQEQNCLQRLIKNQEITEADKEATAYLWETGIVNNNQVFSPLFASYITDKSTPAHPKFSNAEFSKKENLLFSLLLDNLDTVIDRSAIIQSIWPEEQEFGVSDWAIDRLIARVRHKLQKQESSYEVITVKTRGYKLAIKK